MATTTPPRSDRRGRATRRVRALRVRASGIASWTGRSALSVATETVLSRLVTSGTRQTRVSAMRVTAPRAGRPFRVSADAGRAGLAPMQRRPVPTPPPRSG